MWRIIFSLIYFSAPMTVWGLEKAVVLPRRVNHPSIRLGTITGFRDKYHSSGLLTSIGENYSRNFDSKTLVNVIPDARAVVDGLNQFGQYRLGDQLNLGTLKIDADPLVRYEAGVYARGVTENFTGAVVIPVVHYQVQASVTQFGGNVREISAALPADLRSRVDPSRLDLVGGFYQRLNDGGYKSFASRSQSYVADAQILGFYRYFESPFWSGVVKTTLTLPTGPKDDPDDLLDLPFFGQTALGLHFLQDLKPMPNLVVGAYAGYTVKVPDRIVKRVPKDENDVVPDASRKEEVSRDLGDVTTLGFNARYSIGDWWEVGSGLEFGYKGPDSYSGSRGSDYGLLSRDTSSEWQKLQASIEFSTTTKYLNQSFPIPFAVAYEYSDIIAGINIERQICHEIVLKGYF